jgi:hypothetical protein
MEEGTLLRNNYRIERLIGRGGMADVYLAFDMRRQTYVALKVLREDLAQDPDFLRRFSREAEALAKLDHPNIVRFYSLERQGAIAFIVMDYVQGHSLQRRIAESDGPLPLNEITDILHQVGAALQYAHHEGYIHRDIKPGNIMLRDNGEVLLSDFGIARAAESATAATIAAGTPAYMSPEQITGQELDQRSDVYSLGVVLYELASGRRPFTGDERGVTGTTTLARLREAHLRLTPPDPRLYNPALPAGIVEVILRALAKDPAERWPDVVSLVRAWERAVGQPAPALEPTQIIGAPRATLTPPGPETPPPPRTPTPPPPSAPPPLPPAAAAGRRGPGIWTLLAGVGVVGLIAVAALVWRLLLAPGAVTSTPAVDVEKTAQALAAAYAKATADAATADGAATAQAEATLKALVETSLKATAQAGSATVAPPVATLSPTPAAPSATPSPPATPTVTSTASPTATLTATAQPVAVAPALLAYTVTEKFRSRYQVFLINSDGTGQRMLADLASEPSFSPDGRQIVFFAWPGGLDVMNIDGSGRRTIINDGEASFPAWSPDGKYIAYHSFHGVRFEVFVAFADGKGERMLTDGEQASWSPDSKQLVYKGCLGNDCGLMIINFDGSGKRRLTFSPNDGNADWSRDNNRIVFTSERDGNHEIYVVNPDGSGLTRLTNSPGPDAMPVWLPGGRQIAFRSVRDGNWAIWIMNADGSGVRKLTNAKVDPDHWIWEKMAATRR